MSIPKDLNKKINQNPFYLRCCVSGKTPVQRHHNFMWGYSSLQEEWCIVPITAKIHDIIHGKGDYTPEERKEYQDKIDWIMLNRADEETLLKYSKVINLINKKKVLDEKFGTFTGKYAS